MCGRFTLRTPTPVLARTFRLDTFPEWQPRFNIAPTQQVAVIRNQSGHREALTMRWGLIPSWSKDPRIGGRLINARRETVSTKPSFRSAFKKRRCLVAADGYYEWKSIGRTKQPYLIHLGHQPFAMAGLWETWRGDESDGESILSCTIITTQANDIAAEIHDRMPAILPENDWDTWLSEGPAPLDGLDELLEPFPTGEMEVQPASTFVNNARHEGPECLDGGQQELF